MKIFRRNFRIAIAELMDWYAGSEWHLDIQTCNTMHVDNAHVSMTNSEMETLKFLKRNRDEVVEVHVEYQAGFGTYEIRFHVRGKKISFDSIESPVE